MKKELKRLSTALHLKTVYDFVEQFAENNIEPEAGCQMLFIYLDEVLDLTFGWWKFLVDHQCWRLHKDIDRLWNRLHGIHSTTSQRRAFQQAEYVLFGACTAYGLVPDRDIKRPHDIIHRINLLGQDVVKRCQLDEKDQQLANNMLDAVNETHLARDVALGKALAAAPPRPEFLKAAAKNTIPKKDEPSGFAALGDDAK